MSQRIKSIVPRRVAITGLLSAMLPRWAAASGSTGVSDDEIILGQTVAYSGPASSLGVMGRVVAGYFRHVNDSGGINGRRITLLSRDDEYNPAKTVEQTRRLVESDNVLAIVNSVGASTNASVERYLNAHSIPQLFVISGGARFSDPEHAPWTMPLVLSQQAEAHALARYALSEMAEPRVAVLYQNDELGKDYLRGILDRLSQSADRPVTTASFEVTDPTIDSQIVDLFSSGANVLFDAGIPRFTVLAIRKLRDLGWKPLHIIVQPSASISGTFARAGLENCIGIVAAEYLKLPGDPRWASDPDLAAFQDLLRRYCPEVEPGDRLAMVGFSCAAAIALVLARCGNEVTRERLMYEATHLKDVRIPGLLPNVALSTTPQDYSAIKQMQLQRFDGTTWQPLGGIVEG